MGRLAIRLGRETTSKLARALADHVVSIAQDSGITPTVSSTDLEWLAEVVASGRSVLSPSADGGTSAVGSSLPIEFQYGPGSFHRHLAQLSDPTIVVSPGLGLDIDRYRDLVAAAEHRGGGWLRSFLP